MIRSIQERLLNPLIQRYEHWRASKEKRFAELTELDRLHAECLRVITTYGMPTEVDGLLHYRFILPDQELEVTVTAMDREGIIDYENLNPALQFQHLRIQKGMEGSGDMITSWVDPYNNCIHEYQQIYGDERFVFFGGGPEFSNGHLDEATLLYHGFLAESVLPVLGAYEGQIAAMAYPVNPYQ